MRTVSRRIVRLSLVFFIPALFMMSSCQEDIAQPDGDELSGGPRDQEPDRPR